MKFASIDLLDKNILIKIFSHLPIKEIIKLQKVCNYWKSLSTLALSNIKTFDTSDGYFMIKNFGVNPPTMSDLEQILSQCGNFLTILKLHHNGDSVVMSLIAKYCQNLIKLELDFHQYIAEDFVDAFVSMKKLKSIKMTSCHSVMWGSMMFNDCFIDKLDDDNVDNGIDILQSLPEEIEEINLSSCERMMPMDLFFQSAAVKFNSLHSLTLSRWDINDNMMDIITQKTSLINLSLSQCNFSVNRQPVLSKLINLEYLNLVNVDGNINTGLIISIINDCIKLKHLNINGCKKLSTKTVETLEELLTHGPSLDNLETFQCANHHEINDTGIIGLIRRSPNLQQLVLWNTNITIDTLNFSADVAKERKKNLLVIISPWVLNNADDNNFNDYLSVKIHEQEEDEEIPLWMNI